MPAPEPVDRWRAELSAIIVEGFAFLADEFGYVYAGDKLLAKGMHELRVSWRRGRIRVDVVADQFRNEFDVTVRKQNRNKALDVSVGDLAMVFDMPAYSIHLGRTKAERRESIVKMAQTLRAYGRRALEGDEEIFLEVAERRRVGLEKATREYEFKRALLDGRAAWQRRDYAGVVSALSPFSHDLSPGEKKRLELARARLSTPPR